VKNLLTRSLLIAALAALTAACGVSQGSPETEPTLDQVPETVGAPGEQEQAPIAQPGQQEEEDTAPALPTQPQLIDNGGRARLAIATSRAQVAVDRAREASVHTTTMQAQANEGDTDAAQLSQELAETALAQAADAEAQATLMLVDAASLGACACDALPAELEEAAADGNDAAQALIDACADAPDDDDDDDEESGLCDDLAMDLGDVVDVSEQVQEALSSCQSAVDAVVAEGERLLLRRPRFALRRRARGPL
jgi:hypothetical protein